jgi:nucleoside-diphosphate-sugar epimerase
LKEGMQVRGIVRRPKAAKWLEEKGVEIVTGDLLDASTIKSAVEGCSIVVHAACTTEEPPDQKNLNGVLMLRVPQMS